MLIFYRHRTTQIYLYDLKKVKKTYKSFVCSKKTKQQIKILKWKIIKSKSQIIIVCSLSLHNKTITIRTLKHTHIHTPIFKTNNWKKLWILWNLPVYLAAGYHHTIQPKTIIQPNDPPTNLLLPYKKKPPSVRTTDRPNHTTTIIIIHPIHPHKHILNACLPPVYKFKIM